LPDPNQVTEGLREDEPHKEDDIHLAKAVKNDNSDVLSSSWVARRDPKVNWSDAAAKIRPLAIKWWRRHQLRKCLAFKNYKTISGEFT
jgi:hypothetical protein